MAWCKSFFGVKGFLLVVSKYFEEEEEVIALDPLLLPMDLYLSVHIYLNSTSICIYLSPQALSPFFVRVGDGFGS